MPSRRIRTICGLVPLLLGGTISCGAPDSGPPLIVQRDSAGIVIIEAMRPLWGDSSLWSIDPDPLVDLTVSGSGPTHEFFRIRAMKQRPDGSLVLINRGSQQVRLYSREGDYLGALGGLGEGPGEFSNLWRMALVADTTFALDTDGRVTVVSPDMELVRTFAMPFNVDDIHFLGDGTLVGGSTVWAGLEDVANQLIRPPMALVRFDLDGAWIDSIGMRLGDESYSFAFEDEYGNAAALFGKTAQVATLGPGIFYGSSDLMQVEELDLAGNTLRILRIPNYPLGLTDEQADAEREAIISATIPPGMAVPPRLRRVVEAPPAPAVRPAYANMLVDPSGAVWLELYRGTSELDRPPEWLVLDADGTWLGTIEVPDRFRMTDITMETVLGVWRDELDVEHPQVLRLTRGGG